MTAGFLGRMTAVSKANRQKGAAREKRRFICWCHETPFKAPIRFKSKEAWTDWSIHNRAYHDKRSGLGWTEDFVHYDDEGPFVGGQEILVL
jgi:hypothetical protein